MAVCLPLHQNFWLCAWWRDNLSKDNLSNHTLSSRPFIEPTTYRSDSLLNDSLWNDTLSNDSLSKDSLSKDSLSKDSLSKDSLSNRQFIEPTVYRTDRLSKLQFIEFDQTKQCFLRFFKGCRGGALGCQRHFPFYV